MRMLNGHHLLTNSPQESGGHASAADGLCGSLLFDDHDWGDEKYVRLPCSRFDTYYGTLKWTLISECYSECQLKDFGMFSDAIRSYNEYAKSFSRLCDGFDAALGQSLTSRFFDHLLPRIGKLALQLPRLFSRIPVMPCKQQSAISMSQTQAACLVANAFLCTFREQPAVCVDAKQHGLQRSDSIPAPKEGKCFADFTFLLLYATPGMPSNMAKLTCVLHYFERLFVRLDALERDSSLRRERSLDSIITFERRVLQSKPDWYSSMECFRSNDLLVENEEPIEKCASMPYAARAFSSLYKRQSADEAYDADCLWQVDFADRLIGGLVLSSGCVQEEILFSVHPECLVARLFTHALTDDEALLICGVQCIAQHTGYGSTFRFVRGHFDSALERTLYYQAHADVSEEEAEQTQVASDSVKLDRLGRRNTLIFAVDAIPYRYGRFCYGAGVEQFDPVHVTRELNKFFSAICLHSQLCSKYSASYDSATGTDSKARNTTMGVAQTELGWLESSSPVVTGNWGCGAFGGDKRLKAVIQMCAAAQCGRPLVYCTFGDQKLCDQLRNAHRQLADRGITVGQVLKWVQKYYETYEGKQPQRDFLEFLHSKLKSGPCRAS